MLGVVERFLGLVKIEILGGTALGNDHDIRLLFDRTFVILIQECACPAVGCGDIARISADDFLLCIENNVEDEIDARHCACLLDILTHRIAFQLTRA